MSLEVSSEHCAELIPCLDGVHDLTTLDSVVGR
jgi:hypothetical protein